MRSVAGSISLATTVSAWVAFSTSGGLPPNRSANASSSSAGRPRPRAYEA
ncbi:hypothetical protein ACIGBL_28175 [Streptomyces sp. NPDC085614]